MSTFSQLILAFITVNIIDCSVLRGPRKLIGEKYKDIQITWSVQDVLKDTHLKFYQRSMSGNNLIAALSYFSKTSRNKLMTNEDQSPFGDRLKGSCTIENGNGQCDIKISKLKYEDTGSYKFVNSDRTANFSITDVELDIKGGPELCGVQYFPSNMTARLGDLVYGNITLCGKPQPKLKWYLGNKEINGTIDDSMKDQHKYKYSFTLKATRDLQGNNISYRAIGFQDREVTGLTKILMHLPLEGNEMADGLSYGAITGIVLSILAIFVLIIIGVLYYRGTIGNRKSEGVVLHPEEERRMAQDV